jgi:hypothetical protein
MRRDHGFDPGTREQLAAQGQLSWFFDLWRQDTASATAR